MPHTRISSYPEQLTEGLFGQTLTWVLEILPYLEKSGYQPVDVTWDINTLCYEMVIPGTLIPKESLASSPAQKDFNLVELKTNHAHKYDFSGSGFREANQYLNRWFSLPDIPDNELLAQTEGLKMLGLHYRGTDKNLDMSETNRLTREEFIVLVKALLSLEPFDGIFVCSDEKTFPDSITKAIPGMKIFTREQVRSPDNTPLHVFGRQLSSPAARQLSLDAMFDVLWLARCNTVLKCSSALSAWARIVNPSCRLLQLSATKHPWFPVGAVKGFHPHTETERQIMVRTMAGHNLPWP